MSVLCPSCNKPVSILKAHRDGFPCPGCGVALRVDNFYLALAWAILLGGLPMIFVLTLVELLIVIPISITLGVMVYRAMMKLTVVPK
jgi:hypothetical protein